MLPFYESNFFRKFLVLHCLLRVGQIPSLKVQLEIEMTKERPCLASDIYQRKTFFNPLSLCLSVFPSIFCPADVSNFRHFSSSSVCFLSNSFLFCLLWLLYDLARFFLLQRTIFSILFVFISL